MNPSSRQAAETIDGVSRAIAGWAAARLLERVPGIQVRYGPDAERLWKAEMLQRLGHLAVAVAFERVELLVEQVQWSRVAFSSRQVHDTDVVESMHALRDVLAEQLPKQAMVACRMVDQALERVAGTTVPQPSSLLNATGGDSTAARLYLLHLLERNRDRAWHVVHGARLSGRSLAQVYERILVPSMAEVGRMWHMQEASIADEHFVTNATQSMMAQLRMDVPVEGERPWRVLATSVGGDHHDMGVRMLADLFEVAGWKVECLGANTPADEIVAVLDASQTGRPIHVLALGIGSSLSLRPLADTIAAVRASRAAEGVRIIVGGQPFQIVPDLWKLVGADACAPSFSDAVQQSERLMLATAS